MGEETGIQWTDHTFNPWEGCQRVSPGCENCYAETRNARFHPRTALTGSRASEGKGEHWGPPSTTDRLLRAPSYWTQPARWNRDAATDGRRRRVFCASLADVFEDHPAIVRERARLFDLIEHTPHLDWQLLTKRPENMRALAPASWADGWPSNVWAGTTVEDQARADVRIPHLLRVPARVRFLSCEPLLELVDLSEWIDGMDYIASRGGQDSFDSAIDWVIVGGESGSRAREFDLRWAREIVKLCANGRVSCFVKQMGDFPIDGAAGVSLGKSGADIFKAHHGADPSEWPEELRVREFPR